MFDQTQNETVTFNGTTTNQGKQEDHILAEIDRYLSLVDKLRTEIMGLGFSEEESVLALIDIFFCQDWDGSWKQYREDAENRTTE
jgi:hypothetical protein